MNISPNILTIPEIALEKVLCSLTYDEIAKARLVCRKFNQIGGKLLTRGFWQVERRHNILHKKMRGQLPRRESERRSHPLAKHCDILTAVETRLSMLSMTYLKHMDNKTCCFIPGKVLDEIVRILETVEKLEQPPRTHELLQELRDISSMAMEHFDENILPNLQQKVEVSSVIRAGCATSKIAPNVVLLKQVFTDEMRTYKKQAQLNKYQMTSLLKAIKRLETKFKSQTKLLRRSTIKVQEQARFIEEQETKIKEQEAAIAELKRHVEEWDQKLSDLTSELVRARDELLTNSIKPPLITQSKCFGSIKPRTPILKYNDPPVTSDLERKRKLPFTHLMETPPKVRRNLDDTKICNIINTNLTSNISKNIASNCGAKSNESIVIKNDNSTKSGFGSFFSNSLERIIKNPIINIRSRKRKLSGENDYL